MTTLHHNTRSCHSSSVITKRKPTSQTLRREAKTHHWMTRLSAIAPKQAQHCGQRTEGHVQCCEENRAGRTDNPHFLSDGEHRCEGMGRLTKKTSAIVPERRWRPMTLHQKIDKRQVNRAQQTLQSGMKCAPRGRTGRHGGGRCAGQMHERDDADGCGRHEAGAQQHRAKRRVTAQKIHASSDVVRGTGSE